NKNYDNIINRHDIVGKITKIIYPDYIINLNAGPQRLFKYFFAFYSILNFYFPFIMQIKRFGHIPTLKKTYQYLVRLR
ncbi:MAG: hypothetical protein AAB569_06735, partial [Patescibacteria group bacterium]